MKDRTSDGKVQRGGRKRPAGGELTWGFPSWPESLLLASSQPVGSSPEKRTTWSRLASDLSCRHLPLSNPESSNPSPWTWLQVNGKLYPMAKVQLGKMGALHPANRLAAYLTGRVGSGKKRPSCQDQGAAAAPGTVAQACGGGTPPPPPEPPGRAAGR